MKKYFTANENDRDNFYPCKAFHPEHPSSFLEIGY